MGNLDYSLKDCLTGIWTSQYWADALKRCLDEIAPSFSTNLTFSWFNYLKNRKVHTVLATDWFYFFKRVNENYSKRVPNKFVAMKHVDGSTFTTIKRTLNIAALSSSKFELCNILRSSICHVKWFADQPHNRIATIKKTISPISKTR